MDVCPRNGVTDSLLRVEVSVEHLLLLIRRELCKRLNRGVGYCSANAEMGFEFLCRINKHANLRLERLSVRFEFKSISQRKPVIAVFCSSKDADLAKGGRPVFGQRCRCSITCV